MNIIVFCILSALVLTVSSLQKNKQALSATDSHNIGYISDAYFQESQIFYCNSDKTAFGFLSLQNSEEKLSISLRPDEQIIDVNRNNVEISDKKKFLKIFLIEGKILSVRDTYEKEDFSKILRRQSLSQQSDAILSDKDFRTYKLKREKEISESKIILQKNEGEQLIDFVTLNEGIDYFKPVGFIVLAIKQKGSEKMFCLKLTNMEKQIRQECLKYPKSFEMDVRPKLFFSFASFYISFPEKSFVFTKQLELKSEIDTSIKKSHWDFLFLANGKSLSSDKDTIYESQVVFSQPYFFIIMMKISQSSIIFTHHHNQKEQIIGKMKKLDNKQPYQAWIRLPIDEDFSGKNAGKDLVFQSAEVLIQYRNKDLQFVVFKNQEPQVKWIKKAKKIL